MTNKVLLALLTLMLSACSTVKPPPECSGEVRRVNPPNVSVSKIECEKGAA